MSSSSSSPDDEPWPATSQCLTVQESPCLMYHHCPRHQGSQSRQAGTLAVVLGAIRNLTSRSRNAHFFQPQAATVVQDRGAGPMATKRRRPRRTTAAAQQPAQSRDSPLPWWYAGTSYLSFALFWQIFPLSVGLTQRQEKCKPPTEAAAVMVRYQGT